MANSHLNTHINIRFHSSTSSIPISFFRTWASCCYFTVQFTGTHHKSKFFLKYLFEQAGKCRKGENKAEFWSSRGSISRSVSKKSRETEFGGKILHFTSRTAFLYEVISFIALYLNLLSSILMLMLVVRYDHEQI